MKSIFFTLLFLLSGLSSQAQWNNYDYERSLDGVTNDWHSISIPEDVYGKLNRSLNDIRIYGLTSKKDTIEVPYLLKINAEKLTTQKTAFELLNTVAAVNGFYYTYKLEEGTSINNIFLSFKNANFDWKVKLEGSQDQLEWFTIMEDYRILSIKNESSDYSFTNLKFPNASYRYFRIYIETDEKPELQSSKITKKQRTAGVLIDYPINNLDITDEKSRKSTVIDFKLHHPVPVNRMFVNVASDYDYFRSVTMEYLVDSLKTEKGWKYDYKTFKIGTLSSIEKNEFEFNKIIAQKFRITVNNNDNQPLNIESIEVKGFKHELIARFIETASYHLVYGNKSANKANYDITKFKKSIPQNLESLSLGEEKKIAKQDAAGISALFENELWLWAIMGIVILLLGGFTYKMLQKEYE